MKDWKLTKLEAFYSFLRENHPDCTRCKSDSFDTVFFIDGNEFNWKKDNLLLLCKSCSTPKEEEKEQKEGMGYISKPIKVKAKPSLFDESDNSFIGNIAKGEGFETKKMDYDNVIIKDGRVTGFRSKDD